jgi:hypothetical protein
MLWMLPALSLVASASSAAGAVPVLHVATGVAALVGLATRQGLLGISKLQLLDAGLSPTADAAIPASS